jgi:hypothetical protein
MKWHEWKSAVKSGRKVSLHPSTQHESQALPLRDPSCYKEETEGVPRATLWGWNPQAHHRDQRGSKWSVTHLRSLCTWKAKFGGSKVRVYQLLHYLNVQGYSEISVICKQVLKVLFFTGFYYFFSSSSFLSKIKLRPSSMLGKGSTTELNSSPFHFIYLFWY